MGNLESYLISIKDQLSRHDQELLHPVWWNTLVKQIDQISVLKRRLEHQNLDLMAIRHSIYADAEQAAKEEEKTASSSMNMHSSIRYNDSNSFKSGKQLSNQRKGFALLSADIESLKMVIRRLDIEGASENHILSQIRESQRLIRTLSTLINERAPSEALGQLKEVIKTVSVLIPQFDARLEHSEKLMKEYVTGTVPDIARQVSNDVYHENKGKEKEVVYKSEYKMKMTSIASEFQTVQREVDGLQEAVSKIGFLNAKKSLTDKIKQRMWRSTRNLFERWKIFTEDDRYAEQQVMIDKMSKLLRTFRKGFFRLQKKMWLDIWKQKVHMLVTFDKYRIRLRKMLVRWQGRTNPSMGKFFDRWKSTTIVMREEMRVKYTSRTGSNHNQDNQDSTKKEGVLAGGAGGAGGSSKWAKVKKEVFTEETDVIHISNEEDLGNGPLEKDMRIRCLDLLQLPASNPQNQMLMMTKALIKIQKSHDNTRDTITDQVRELDVVSKNLDIVKREAREWTDNQCRAVGDNMSKWIARATVSLSDMGTDIESMGSKVDRDLRNMKKGVMELEKTTENQETHLTKIDEKIERIMLLQGDILQRVEQLETTAIDLRRNNEISNELASDAKMVSTESLTLAKDLQSNVTHSLDFFDGEIKSMKGTTKLLKNMFEEMSLKFQISNSDMMNMEAKLTQRLEDLEEHNRKMMQPLALPKELAEICFIVEDRMLKYSSINVADLFKEEGINEKLSNFCIRLARQIHDTSYSQSVESIIAGEDLGPDQATQETKEKGMISRAVQSKLLEDFSEEFVRLLREKEPKPGYVRAQARVMLHSRFTAAVEMALNEMNIRAKKTIHSVPADFLDYMAYTKEQHSNDYPNTDEFGDTFGATSTRLVYESHTEGISPDGVYDDEGVRIDGKTRTISPLTSRAQTADIVSSRPRLTSKSSRSIIRPMSSGDNINDKRSSKKGNSKRLSMAKSRKIKGVGSNQYPDTSTDLNVHEQFPSETSIPMQKVLPAALDNTDGMNEIGRAVHPDDLIPMIPTSRRIQGHNEAKEDMVDTTKDTTLEGEE